MARALLLLSFKQTRKGVSEKTTDEKNSTSKIPINEAFMISSIFLQGFLAKGSLGNLFQNGTEAQALGKGQQPFAGILSQMMGTGKNAVAKTSSEKTAGGHAFLEQLKKALMAKGFKLDQLVANEEALDSFAQLLVGAGFKQKDVASLVAELKANGSEKGGASLSDLFNGASQLTPVDSTRQNMPKLDISALPYIETILAELGASPRQIQNALSSAKGTDGIDIQQLVSNLKQIISEINAQNTPASGLKEQEDLLAMMKRIGLLGANPEAITQMDRLIADLKNNNNYTLGEETGGLDLASVMLQLEQMALQFDIKDGALDGLIAQAKEKGEMPRESVVAFLTRLRDGLAKVQGVLSQNQQAGALSLDQFVAALETRLSSHHKMNNMLSGVFQGQGQREAVSDFINNVNTLQDTVEPKAVASNTRLVSAAHLSSAFTLQAKNDTQKKSPHAALSDAKRISTTTTAASGKNTPVDSGMEKNTQNVMGEKAIDKTDDILAAVVKHRQSNSAYQEDAASEPFAKALKLSKVLVENTATGPSARTLPGYLLEQVSRQIIRLRQSNQQEMTLQLKPPHLGRMKLRVEQSNSGLRVNIIVEQAATKDMLLAQSNDLKTALAEQGLRFDKIDVETQADFDRSMAQANQDAGHSGGRGRRGFRRNAETLVQDRGGASEPSLQVQDNGLLNLVA